MLGIPLGVVVMVLLVGGGLGAVFERLPVIYTALKYLGAAYLVWLAWKIAGSGGIDGGNAGTRPFGFWQAAAFQWVNPKAWIMAIGVIATDRKSTRLNSSHLVISYAVFCLEKKKQIL